MTLTDFALQEGIGSANLLRWCHQYKGEDDIRSQRIKEALKHMKPNLKTLKDLTITEQESIASSYYELINQNPITMTIQEFVDRHHISYAALKVIVSHGPHKYRTHVSDANNYPVKESKNDDNLSMEQKTNL
jgi:hypothetical protein